MTNESELWFGFTRKKGEFSATSCTLNSWIWENYFSDAFKYLVGAQ